MLSYFRTESDIQFIFMSMMKNEFKVFIREKVRQDPKLKEFFNRENYELQQCDNINQVYPIVCKLAKSEKELIKVWRLIKKLN